MGQLRKVKMADSLNTVIARLHLTDEEVRKRIKQIPVAQMEVYDLGVEPYTTLILALERYDETVTTTDGATISVHSDFYTVTGYDGIYSPKGIHDLFVKWNGEFFLKSETIETFDGEQIPKKNATWSKFYRAWFADLRNSTERVWCRGYHKRPKLKFCGTGKKYLGIELELEFMAVGDEHDSLCRSIFKRDPHWYFNHDSSLSEGFEAITLPLSPKKALSLDWNGIYERYYDEDGMGNCASSGMHIHINRNYFKGKRQIGHLVRFFNENYNELLSLFERDEDQASDYCKKYHITKRYSFEDSYHDWSEEVYRLACNMRDRYRVVNLCNVDTVEIRIFSTPDTPSKARAYIQFTDIVSTLANCKDYKITLKAIKERAYKKRYLDLLQLLSDFGYLPLV